MFPAAVGGFGEAVAVAAVAVAPAGLFVGRPYMQLPFGSFGAICVSKGYLFRGVHAFAALAPPATAIEFLYNVIVMCPKVVDRLLKPPAMIVLKLPTAVPVGTSAMSAGLAIRPKWLRRLSPSTLTLMFSTWPFVAPNRPVHVLVVLVDRRAFGPVNGVASFAAPGLLLARKIISFPPLGTGLAKACYSVAL